MKTTGINHIVRLMGIATVCTLFLSSCNHSKTEKAILLKERLYTIVDSAPGTVGIAFISDRDTVTVNGGVHFPMMSIFKLHQALAVASEIDANHASIDSLVHVSRHELDPDTWSPMLELIYEKEFDISIRDLIKYSLTLSDNNASNLLFKHILSPSGTDSLIRSISDNPSFRIMYSEKEMKEHHSKAYQNYSTPLSAASLISQVFDSTFTTISSIDSIRQDLTNVITGTDRLGAVLRQHQDLFFAHKTGRGFQNDAVELIAHNDV
ncbi:MAG: serine hydrolase [Duncaniella sp.]|nr:serine hydrolase [Duncaniella sp.]